LSIKSNNKIILLSIVMCILLVFTVNIFPVEYTPSILFLSYWIFLLIGWFLSLLYGPFARYGSWLFDEDDPLIAEKYWLFIAVMEAIGARVERPHKVSSNAHDS
jgi:hypothetical protein